MPNQISAQKSEFTDLCPIREIIQTRIISNRPIAKNQWSLWLAADDEKPLPDFDLGNFCMLSLTDFVDPLIPRPFAIVEKKEGRYHFIYRIHGKLTHQLVKLPAGSKVGLLGPLGKGLAKSLLNTGKHTFIAGGVGYASLIPVIEALPDKQKQNAKVYYGVREDLEVIRRTSVACEFASDNGSVGFHGRLPDLLKKNSDWQNSDAFYVCGPTGMMKALYEVLPPEKTYYFLEETMGCGVGICVGCVIPVKSKEGTEKRVRSCIEGPIFNGSVLQYWKEGSR